MDSISLAVKARIDKKCDEYELAFQRGERPKIEGFLEDSAETDRPALLEAMLLLELDCRQAEGDNPTLEEYLARFPQREEVVRRAIHQFKRKQETFGDTKRSEGDAETIEDLPQSTRYRTSRKLGEGAFGVVYLAFDSELEREVAMKVPRRNQDIDVVNFLDEAKTAAKLSHPNLVAVYDSGTLDDGRPFVVMEYIKGGTLADQLESATPSPASTAETIRQIADALHYAHQQGFVHRDLKPGNVLFDEKGDARVADFGLALHERDQRYHRGDRSGTPLYRSPEQVRGEADWIDGRSDIWALGTILYQMLVGRHPFDGATGAQLDEEILHREPKPPRQLDDSVPEWLEEICLKCLSKSPDRRFATGDAVLKAIQRAEAKLQSGGVEIGRDAIGNTIVSANGNVVIVQSGAKPTFDESPGIGRNPYKGLASFDEQDADVFFGRERQIQRLWDTLRDLRSSAAGDQTIPFLPILGPSGCGKSSVARAGLIAELAQNPLPGTKDCRVIVLTPSTRPIESLASVLARTITGDPAPLAKAREFEQELATENDAGECDGLRRIISMLPDLASSPVILFVDQFEEIYSLCQSATDRQIFVELLLCAARDSAAHTSVIITLRSDFIGETHDNQQLNQLVAEQGVLIPAMNDQELHNAIHMPASEVGFFFDDEFVDQLVSQTRGREGALPMLQFALTRIWLGVQEGKKPQETLHQIGGVGGALAGEAQHVFENLPTDDQKIAKRAFLAMVQIGEGTRDTRRRATVKSMITASDDEKHVHAVLSRFAGADTRLVTMHAGAGSEEGYSAEVTHETLIDHWPQLREWLDEGRDEIRFERRLDTAAQDWSERGRLDGLLWRTPDLELLQGYESGAELTRLQSEFFRASDDLAAAEQRRKRQRTWVYQIGSTAIGVLAVAACFFGWRSNQKAELAIANEKRANAHERLAVDRGEMAVKTIETLAKEIPEVVEMLPGEYATAARKDILNTALLGLKGIHGGDQTELAAIGRASFIAAAAHRGKGDIYRKAGATKKALDSYQTSMRLVAQSRPDYADKPWTPLDNLSRLEDLIGETHLAATNVEDATKRFKSSLTIRREILDMGKKKLGEEYLRINYEIGGSYTHLGRICLRDESRHSEALELFEKAVSHRGLLANVDGASGIVRREYAGALWYRGMAKRGLGRYEEAVLDLRGALRILEKVLEKWRKEGGIQGEYTLEKNVAASYIDVGQAYLLWKKPEEAKPYFAKAEQYLSEQHKKYARDNDVIQRYWKVLYSLGTLWLEDDKERSTEYFQQACEILEKGSFSEIPRMLSLARCHKRDQAQRLAEKIATEHADRSNYLYQAACGYALCAWSARTEAADDEGLISVSKELQQKALDTLSSAVDKGFSNAVELRDNPELDEIRDTAQFQQILERIE